MNDRQIMHWLIEIYYASRVIGIDPKELLMCLFAQGEGLIPCMALIGLTKYGWWLDWESFK